MTIWRSVPVCIPIQNPSCAFGRFLIPRYNGSVNETVPSVNGTGEKKNLFKEKNLKKDLQIVTVLLPCTFKAPCAPSLILQCVRQWPIGYEHGLVLSWCSFLTCLSHGFLPFGAQKSSVLA